MLKGKKLLAIMLIFTMTFSYFSIVTEAVAATSFISIFGIGSDTGNENVEFEAFLTDNQGDSNAVVSDVNNENLNIKLQLDVKNSGYLKNGKVEIKADEEKELNFVINEDEDITEKYSDVQSLEKNVITLNKVENFSDMLEVLIPIEYKNEKYINDEKLSNTAKVILSGIYVDEDGEENEISKEVELTLAWKDERNVTIKDEVTKYIQFGNDGIILQTSIKVDNSNIEKNTLPVKETEINIDVPKIDGVAPSEINVVANSTLGTNGKGVGEVSFSEDNWNYNSDEAKLNIKIENQKELVTLDNENYLKEENEEVIEEERYYSAGGVDEYLITYTYRNVKQSDEINIETNADAKVTIFSGVESEENITVVESNVSNKYNLTGQTGNIVSYNVENETKNVSKAYGYLNKEVEFDSKTAINISYKDMVEEILVEDQENFYVDKSEENISTDNLYYKQISVSEENFKEILGDDGYIEILDDSQNVLFTINKEITINEDGNYVVNFDNKISKVTIKTSAPIAEGNLIISNKKAISNIDMSKADYSNVEYFAMTTKQQAKFSYVSDLVDLGNCTIKTKLDDTKTDVNLVIDRDNLSTVTTNSNVEMRLELNNDKETSDVYGNSIFEIEMPEYITSLDLTNTNMIYGEGLEIQNIETFVNDNGRAIIRVTVSGKQNDFNSGVLTNGTNIVLNVDVTLDKYTPSLEQKVKAYIYNSEATGYENPTEYNSETYDYVEEKIDYSAPSGLIAINTLSNYNSVGSVLTSVKEGEQVDYIDIYSEAKTATMEVVVVNNNDNSVSDLSILGRIPFKDVKDIATDEDLGTTLDTKLLSGIISNESNNGEFTVYYSTNKEATKDLSDSSNKWETDPENFDDVKSYLIVPSNSEYEMEAKQVLKFTYNYEIPENLNHNENIYGTFLAYYTNKLETATIDETSKPDLVGLTTGQGPELEVKLSSNVETAKVNDEIKLIATLKNTGKDLIQNLVANIPVPENMSVVSAESDRDTISVEQADGNIVVKGDTLSVDTEVKITVVLKVENINDEDTLKISATATAKDLGTELSSNKVSIKLMTSEFIIDQFIDSDEDPEYYYQKGSDIKVIIYIKNANEKKYEDIKVTTKIPEGLKIVKSYTVGGTPETGIKEIDNANYDSSNNLLTWNIGESNAYGTTLKLNLTVDDLKSGITSDTVTLESEVSAKDTDTYKAKDLNINIGRSSLLLTQTSNTPTYVTEGQIIDYTFEIKNEGSTAERDVVLKDIIPNGILVKSIKYTNSNNPDEETTIGMSSKDKAEVTLSVPGNSTTTVNVSAIAENLDGVQESTVTNSATISSENIEEVESNSVTHIIKADENKNTSSSEESSFKQLNQPTTSTTDITKSYKLTGVAWLDENQNGMRDDQEKRMSNISAMLVDSNSGVIKASTTTNDNGEYAFTGLQNGSYLVIFKYDTTLYTTTTYKKEGVESNNNSDAVTTKIEQDGRKENAAITDVINVNGTNVLNVDIGLVESAQFSLKLDKTISKVTVQNAQGTETKEFDNTKLAKYDIAAKYLSGTTVYVEYKFTVTNNGDLAGYATELVDYIPEGMTFNSNLNPDWYTGTNGNLYTKALADIELVKGESREVKLVLTKQMTGENTGLVSNTAEISEDYNIYGVSDINSTPANKAQGEDDMSTADTILTVKTGESLIYVSGIIIAIIFGGIVAFVVYERVLKNKRNGGV